MRNKIILFIFILISMGTLIYGIIYHHDTQELKNRTVDNVVVYGIDDNVVYYTVVYNNENLVDNDINNTNVIDSRIVNKFKEFGSKNNIAIHKNQIIRCSANEIEINNVSNENCRILLYYDKYDFFIMTKSIADYRNHPGYSELFKNDRIELKLPNLADLSFSEGDCIILNEYPTAISEYLGHGWGFFLHLFLKSIVRSIMGTAVDVVIAIIPFLYYKNKNFILNVARIEFGIHLIYIFFVINDYFGLFVLSILPKYILAAMIVEYIFLLRRTYNEKHIPPGKIFRLIGYVVVSNIASLAVVIGSYWVIPY